MESFSLRKIAFHRILLEIAIHTTEFQSCHHLPQIFFKCREFFDHRWRFPSSQPIGLLLSFHGIFLVEEGCLPSHSSNHCFNLFRKLNLVFSFRWYWYVLYTITEVELFHAWNEWVRQSAQRSSGAYILSSLLLHQRVLNMLGALYIVVMQEKLRANGTQSFTQVICMTYDHSALMKWYKNEYKIRY